MKIILRKKNRRKNDKRPVTKQQDDEPAPKDEAPVEPKKDYLVAPQPKKPKAPVEKACASGSCF